MMDAFVPSIHDADTTQQAAMKIYRHFRRKEESYVLEILSDFSCLGDRRFTLTEGVLSVRVQASSGWGMDTTNNQFNFKY
jgi:hypothetical protein